MVAYLNDFRAIMYLTLVSIPFLLLMRRQALALAR